MKRADDEDTGNGYTIYPPLPSLPGTLSKRVRVAKGTDTKKGQEPSSVGGMTKSELDNSSILAQVQNGLENLLAGGLSGGVSGGVSYLPLILVAGGALLIGLIIAEPRR